MAQFGMAGNLVRGSVFKLSTRGPEYEVSSVVILDGNVTFMVAVKGKSAPFTFSHSDRIVLVKA
jgi:hypothetical protein